MSPEFLNEVKAKEEAEADAMIAPKLPEMLAQAVCAPLTRVVLVLQTQAIQPAIRNGEIQRYSGVLPTLLRLHREHPRLLWAAAASSFLIDLPTQWISAKVVSGVAQLATGNRKRTKEEGPRSRSWYVLRGGALLATAVLTTVLTFPLECAQTSLTASVGPAPLPAPRPYLARMFTEVVPKTIPMQLSETLSIAIGYTCKGVIENILGIALMRMAENYIGGPGPSLLVQFLIKTTGSLCGNLLQFPWETVRFRLRLQPALSPADRPYSHAPGAVIAIAREEGLKGFYGGIAAYSVQTIIAGALTIGFQRLLHGRVSA